jgi:hypothetical protein
VRPPGTAQVFVAVSIGRLANREILPPQVVSVRATTAVEQLNLSVLRLLRIMARAVEEILLISGCRPALFGMFIVPSARRPVATLLSRISGRRGVRSRRRARCRHGPDWRRPGKRGRRPVGVDLALPMLARAAERFPGCVDEHDVLAPPFRLGAAAAMVAVNVLHLIGDLPAAAAALLRPGGRLLISGIEGNRQSNDELSAIDGDVSHQLRPTRHPTGPRHHRCRLRPRPGAPPRRSHAATNLHTIADQRRDRSSRGRGRSAGICPMTCWPPRSFPSSTPYGLDLSLTRHRWIEWRSLVLEDTQRVA